MRQKKGRCECRKGARQATPLRLVEWGFAEPFGEEKRNTATGAIYLLSADANSAPSLAALRLFQSPLKRGVDLERRVIRPDSSE